MQEVKAQKEAAFQALKEAQKKKQAEDDIIAEARRQIEASKKAEAKMKDARAHDHGE